MPGRVVKEQVGVEIKMGERHFLGRGVMTQTCVQLRTLLSVGLIWDSVSGSELEEGEGGTRSSTVTRSGGLGVTVTSNPATLFGNVGGGTFFRIDR